VMANIGFAFMPEFSVTHPESVRRPLVDPAVGRTVGSQAVCVPPAGAGV